MENPLSPKEYTLLVRLLVRIQRTTDSTSIRRVVKSLLSLILKEKIDTIEF